VSQATVHHYFGSKDQLRAAVVEAMYTELATLQSKLGEITSGAMVQAEIDIEATIRRMVQTSFRFCLQHLPAVRMTTREAIDHSKQQAARQRDFLFPFLDETSAWLGRACGHSPQALRLMLRSISLLIVRYALLSPAEMKQIVRGPPTKQRAKRLTSEAVTDTIEAHLGDVACRLLLG
jgi:AcrR family transcriptional regulator